MRCATCGSEMRATSEPITEEYKGTTIRAVGIEHFTCDTCGEYELGPDDADKLSQQLLEGYAHARGLLTPAQIRDARKRLGLTQAQFEALLGVSTPTASRWETGAASPSKSVCNLIRLLAKRPTLKHELEGRTSDPYTNPLKVGATSYTGWTLFQGGVGGRTPKGGCGAYHVQRFSQRGHTNAKEG